LFKVDFSLNIYQFETQPYTASLIFTTRPNRASYLDFLLARSANNSTQYAFLFWRSCNVLYHVVIADARSVTPNTLSLWSYLFSPLH